MQICCRVFTGNPGPRPEKMLDKIECPVLVAWGVEDPWTPLNGTVGKFFQAQALKRDSLELVTLPGTGELPNKFSENGVAQLSSILWETGCHLRDLSDRCCMSKRKDRIQPSAFYSEC